MRVFITGIAGFIGFHLANALLAAGHQVRGIDNFNAYYDPSLKNLRTNILQKNGALISKESILELSNPSEELLSFNPTHVIHLAAQAGVRYSLENPQAYIETNIDGFFHVLEFVRKIQPTNFLFASSSSVYGNSSESPSTEENACNQPASLYGATKKANEILAYSYHHLYQLPMTGLRFFTVYGSFGRPDMAYFHFAHSIMKEKPIKLFNYGKMERDFTHIYDIVDGILSAMNLNNGFHLLNLGNGHPQPLKKLVELLEKYLGKKAIIQLEKAPPGDLFHTYASIEKSKKMLGYVPVVSLEKGIKEFVDWFQEYQTHRPET